MTLWGCLHANSMHRIGKRFPGIIQRVACDPYVYTPEGSSESITLTHSYAYSDQGTSVEEVVMQGEVG
jgi:hypothetical protein